MGEKNKSENSKNTKNPFDLLAGIELRSKECKNLKVGIQASELCYVDKRSGYVMKKFDVITSSPEKVKKKLSEIEKLFNKIEKFCKYCKNPIEVTALLCDAYNANKDILNISFKSCPVYSDGLDSKFLYDKLIKNN